MNISEAIAIRIEELCQQKGLTINKLATLSGVTQSTIDSILKGKSKNPRLATIKKICNGFNMTISEFLDHPIFDEAEDD